MGAIDQMLSGAIHRTNLTPAAALGMTAVDTAIGFGTSVGLGEIYTRYPDKWYGKHAFAAVAAAGKLLEVILTLFTGPSFLSGAAGAVGQAGVNALGIEVGLKHARDAKGIALVKVPAGTNVKALKPGSPVPASTAIGALPEGSHGLAWDHITHLAASH